MEQIVKANGVDIWCETFGDPADPAVLLIMGVATQGIAWEDVFCQKLAAEGRFVIRYDHRDTGKSTVRDYDEAPYTLVDMADDAAAMLTAIGVDKVHVVGASMGGMVAQEFALNHPERTLTLTSMISSPAVYVESTGEWTGGLPMLEDRAIQHLTDTLMAEPPTTVDGQVEQFMGLVRMMVGTYQELDEEAVAAVKRLEIERAQDLDMAQNHNLAIMASEDRTERLGSLTLPTLIVHGTVDPMFQLPHGEATAKAIPGARLVVVEGMGHELPRHDELIPMLLEHTALA